MKRLPLLLLAVLIGGAAPGLRADPDMTPATPPTPHPSFIYTLTVGDKVHVEVVGEADLTTLQTIDVLGNINLTYVGQIHVAGLTKDQAQKAIEDAYVTQRYLVHPQARVTIDEYAPREVAISGMVKNPGRFLLPPEGTLSVVELVTKAGGFTDIAKGTDVLITHVGGPGGKKTVIHVDVKDILEGKGKMKADDPVLLLQAGDLVYVPESLI
ncbi:MAG TPA: polysaccharide biosynthesis/export family protein [Opitutaceae bacterium]|nr:polysaccharide biosynthesis/export family protein [Opitutaceae bacterium]